MGEYIVYKGQLTKIGTCEDLYYARYEGLKRAIESGFCDHAEGNLHPDQYLLPDNGFRYRFPFPDEDDLDFKDYCNRDFNRSLEIPLDETIAPDLFRIVQATVEWLHYSVYLNPWKDNRFSLSVPCPLARAEWVNIKDVELINREIAIGLQQVKQVEGCFWVVVGCLYCGSKMRLNRELAEELTRCIEARGFENWEEINRRILSGYEESKHKDRKIC